MNLLDKIRDLLARSLDERVENAEDPSAAVRRIIGELRTNLAEARAMLAVTIRDTRSLERQVADAERDEARWHLNARQALGVGREDLAREALKRQMAARKFRDDLATEHGKLAATVESVKRVVVDLERAYKEAQTRERVLLARRRRLRQAEYLRQRFPERARELLKAALEELEDDVDKDAFTASLSEDPLERRFRELEARDDLVDDELTRLKDELEEGPDAPSRRKRLPGATGGAKSGSSNGDQR